MRRFLVVLILSVAVLGSLAAANFRREGGRPLVLDWRIAPVPPKEVQIEAPGRSDVVETITAPGTVEAVDEAQIASQLLGKVVEVLVKDGDSVARGDLLVKLEETDARARLDSIRAKIDRLRAGISQAEADLEKAGRDALRSGQLSVRGVASATEVADAGTLLTRARAAALMIRKELAEAEAMERTSRQELDRTEIKAPIDGMIAGLNVEVGEIIIPGTMNLPGSVLMTVTNLQNLQVRAEVDETDVPLVKTGQPARVYPQSDQRHPIRGSVDRVAPKGKKATGGEVVSFETLVRVEDDRGALRPGMTTTVEVEVRRADRALCVPVQAVVHRRRKDLPDTPEVRAWAERNARSPGEKAQEAETRYIQIVFVEEEDVAHARPVEIGLSDERRVEVLAGLGADARVIVGPFRTLDELKDGSPVKRPEPTAPPPSPTTTAAAGVAR